jgi:TPR repeat protein/predicted Ser/Thr protein kinase
MECQESFPGKTMICPHDGSQLATTLVRSPVGLRLSDRYEIVQEIGRGGMGVIYKAHDLQAKPNESKTVAIKLLINDAGNNETVRARFTVEARAASALSHPNIIKVYEYDVTPEGLPFIVMEYLEGIPLDELLESGGPSKEELLQFVIQVCDALSHAHRRSVIHRDIKPSNIMIVKGEDGKGKAVVVDFGIAKIFTQPGQTSMRLTQTGEVFGSPLYMSPEQCMGQKLDNRSDVYALGCLLYECITGSSPFKGENFLNVIFQHVNDPVQPFAKEGPDFVLEPIILKALEKKPESRYQNMVEFRQALEHCHRLLTSGEEQDDTEYDTSLDKQALQNMIDEANAGDVNVQYDLGLFYRYGHFMDEPDEEKGFEWCLKAAKNGLAAAQLCVADLYHYGWGVEVDFEQALYWYQAAAGQDLEMAMSAIGSMYDLGEGVPEDKQMAVKWFLQAAELEHVLAQNALGWKYKVGFEGTEADLLESARWFLRAAEQGDADSQLQVGYCYRYGEGLERDYVECVQWFRLAAEQGLPEAQRALAICYDEGTGVVRNSFEALRWMNEAVRNGDGPAHTWLGYWNMMAENDLPTDYKKAVSYFREAVELGDYQAHFYLGDCYSNGFGVVRSEKTAAHWYKSAAQHDISGAQFQLARCYRDGLGVEQNDKLFMKWLRKAAEGNDVEALYELGMHYSKLNKPNNATKWLQLANELGHKKAQRALDAIAEKKKNKNV